MSNDHTQSLEIAGRLMEAVQTLQDISDDVAVARQVREFSSERRKNLLAVYMMDYANLPANKAETMARQSEGYLMEFRDLEEESRKSEKLIAKWAAWMCRYEAARSLLSYSKHVRDDLGG